MPRVGDKFEVEGIIVEIMEVAPYTSFANLRQLMIGYRIKDKLFTSPIAHIFVDEREDLRPQIDRIVATYRQVRDTLIAGTK